jgi:cytochrome b561
MTLFDRPLRRDPMAWLAGLAPLLAVLALDVLTRGRSGLDGGRDRLLLLVFGLPTGVLAATVLLLARRSWRVARLAPPLRAEVSARKRRAAGLAELVVVAAVVVFAILAGLAAVIA